MDEGGLGSCARMAGRRFGALLLACAIPPAFADEPPSSTADSPLAVEGARVSPSGDHAAKAAPRTADAAEAAAHETMTVTAKRKGKGHDRILATPTPEGRASIADWLSHRHARCRAVYAAEGRTLRVHKILPTTLPQWKELLMRGCAVWIGSCDDLFSLYNPRMLRKFLDIGYTELRHEGLACEIEANLPAREVTARCDELHPQGIKPSPVGTWRRNVGRGRKHERCVREGLATLTGDEAANG